MSDLVAAPDALASAATNLERIRAALSAANGAAAAPTTGVVASAADDISVAVASFLSGHAQQYQALSERIGDFHQQIAQLLNSNAGSYAAAEAANAKPL